ncbi:ycf2 domain protein [Medicago truncatula]|uniref:Ycf2 domain protein n=1 Tax=Medicago truncatula TaxID=3880 RepID=G7IPY4_MEDTR|nr:ycf2 domain protein [Medicago truncatula]
MSITTIDYALPNKNHNKYDVFFHSDIIHTMITNKPFMVDKWLSSIKPYENNNRFLVGLDVECLFINRFEISYADNHLFPKEIKEFLGNPTRADQSFLYDRWSELQLDLNPTERLFKKEEDVSFVLLRQSENKEIANIVKIHMYLQNTVSIHPILSDPGCDGVAKDELYSSDSFLNKNRLFWLFDLFDDRNRPDLVYHKGFSFSIDSSGLDQKQKFVYEVNSRDESKKKSLLVLVTSRFPDLEISFN